MRDSIVVYRSPIEQAYWDAVMNDPLGVAIVAAKFFLLCGGVIALFYGYGYIRRKWNRRQRSWNTD